MLSASTVIGTGQIGSSLAEVGEETDLVLKTVAKSLRGLLCVHDKVVIKFFKFYIPKYCCELGSTIVILINISSIIN